MKLIHPTPELAEHGLRALTMIAAEGGPPSPAARALLAAAQRNLLGTSLDIDALAPITPEALAAAVSDPALRRQLVQGMVVMTLTDGPSPPAKVALVERFAHALDVDAAEVKSVRLLADQRLLLFRLDFLRRSHIAEVVKHQLEDHGLLGTVKALLGQRGYVEDPALAARYRALESLPEGTLGHQLIRYYRRNGFSLPGEKGGFPEAGLYHDFTHVLGGYDTDSQGEMQIAGFIAGYKRENPFFVILFVTLTFSAGINVTPLPQPHIAGIFAEPGLADAVFRAIERGSRVTVDLSDRWDHWAYVERPIDEVRRELGIVDP
jgi:ubiquinone biosynthesis protein Coq4